MGRAKYLQFSESTLSVSRATRAGLTKHKNITESLSFLFCSDKTHENLIKTNLPFNHYILSTACAKIETMCTAPEYKQIKYSKSNFKYLTESSRIIFSIFLKNFIEIFDEFDAKTAYLAIECFRQCLTTAVKLYERKLDQFLIVCRKLLVAMNPDSTRLDFHFEFIRGQVQPVRRQRHKMVSYY